MAKNYYEVLQVSTDASQEDIKKAYRKLVRNYHPDHPGGNGEKTQELNKAYETLGDPQKRAEYDRMQRGSHTATTRVHYSYASPPTPAQPPKTLENVGSFSDLVDYYYQEAKKTHPKTIEIDPLVLTWNEAFFGVRKRIYELKTDIPCGVTPFGNITVGPYIVPIRFERDAEFFWYNGQERLVSTKVIVPMNDQETTVKVPIFTQQGRCYVEYRYNAPGNVSYKQMAENIEVIQRWPQKGWRIKPTQRELTDLRVCFTFV